MTQLHTAAALKAFGSTVTQDALPGFASLDPSPDPHTHTALHALVTLWAEEEAKRAVNVTGSWVLPNADYPLDPAPTAVPSSSISSSSSSSFMMSTSSPKSSPDGHAHRRFHRDPFGSSPEPSDHEGGWQDRPRERKPRKRATGAEAVSMLLSPAVAASAAVDPAHDSDLRPSIYAVVAAVGADQFSRYASPAQLAKLVAIREYETFLVGKTHRRLYEELEAEGVKPVAQDASALVDPIQHAKAVAEHVRQQQAQLEAEHKQAEQQELLHYVASIQGRRAQDESAAAKPVDRGRAKRLSMALRLAAKESREAMLKSSLDLDATLKKTLGERFSTSILTSGTTVITSSRPPSAAPAPAPRPPSASSTSSSASKLIRPGSGHVSRSLSSWQRRASSSVAAIRRRAGSSSGSRRSVFGLCVSLGDVCGRSRSRRSGIQ